jgi:hypothetical protein
MPIRFGIAAVVAFALGFAFWHGSRETSAPATAPSASPAASPDEPTLDAEYVELAMGDVPRGTVVRRSMKLRNRADSPVTVRVDRTSCGCTSADVSPKTVGPGAATELSVVFDVQDRTGEIKGDISLISNVPISGQATAPSVHLTHVSMRGTIDATRGVVPRVLKLPPVWRGESGRSEPIKLELHADDTFVFQAIRWKDELPWIDIDLPGAVANSRAEALEASVLVNSHRAPSDLCDYLAELFIEGQLNGEPVGFKVGVHGEIKDSIGAEPRVLLWNRAARSETRRATLTSRWNRNVVVDDTNASDSEGVTWSVLENGTEHPIIEFQLRDPESNQVLRDRLTIRARDEEAGEFTVLVRIIAM